MVTLQLALKQVYIFIYTLLQRGNANVLIERHRLQEKKHDIEELMHMLMTRYDLLSKHEFAEKKKQLEEKHKEIE